MSSPDPPVQVTWMPDCLREAARVAQRVPLPVPVRLAEILREAAEQLAQDPRAWGDPYSALRGMRVTLYARTFVRDGLILRYAVHTDRPFVFVHRIEPVRGGPFDQPGS